MTAQLKQLGAKIKRGDARIIGKVSLAGRWPDEPHAWIVEDLLDQKTVHVPCALRPDWACNETAALLGRLGGSSKSESKSAAARANGAKGGRPKKTK